MNQFITNITSPKSISPLMQSRNRLASCNNQAKPRLHYLHMVTNASSYRMKANSLPSILDSENDGDAMDDKEDSNKSPTSTASYGKKKVRSKPWKYLQRQRTTEEMIPLEIEEGRNIIMEQAKLDIQTFEECNGFRRVSGAFYLFFFLIIACALRLWFSLTVYSYRRSLWIMALKWIQILYLLVLYYLIKSRLVMLLPFAVGKTLVSRVTAGEVVYNNRYVPADFILYYLCIIFFLSFFYLFYLNLVFAVVPNERYGPG